MYILDILKCLEQYTLYLLTRVELVSSVSSEIRNFCLCYLTNFRMPSSCEIVYIKSSGTQYQPVKVYVYYYSLTGSYIRFYTCFSGQLVSVLTCQPGEINKHPFLSLCLSALRSGSPQNRYL